MMRALLVAVAVLALLAVAADAAATVLLQRWTAHRAEETLEAPVDVDLQGWPVALRAVTGSIPRASLTATDVPVTEAGTTLSRVQATLTDVDPHNAGDALAAGELPPATGGTWTAELDATDLQAALPESGQARLAEGVLRVTLAGVEIEATVRAEDGRLVVVPANPLLDWARLELGFEELPGAPTVEVVDVTPEAIRVEGRLHPPPPDQAESALPPPDQAGSALPPPGRAASASPTTGRVVTVSLEHGLQRPPRPGKTGSRQCKLGGGRGCVVHDRPPAAAATGVGGARPGLPDPGGDLRSAPAQR